VTEPNEPDEVVEPVFTAERVIEMHRLSEAAGLVDEDGDST